MDLGFRLRCGSRETVREINPGRLKVAVRIRSGQVAQVVERSPEKAGVGGSTPSLATKSLKFNNMPSIINPTH